MAHRAARLLAIALLLALVACGGCAERGGRTVAGAPAATPSPPPEPPAPPPTPTPRAVVARLACQVDADCANTPLPTPLAGPGDCYCPLCPQPVAATAAAEHEAGWRAYCGAPWAERAGCRAPMCARPSPARCRDGTCAAGPG